MSGFFKTLPAKEKEPDEGRFQEECHKAFNGKRGAENVADIVRVVGAVCAKLEFHRDTGSNPQREIDAKKFAPEFCHVFVDFFSGYHVAGFHDDQHERKPERERHENEVIHGGQCKLPP